MSLDHDLQNLPRLSDEDREAIEDHYSVIPALMSDEAITQRDADHDYSDVDRGDGAGTDADASSQPLTANDAESDSLALQVEKLLETLLGVTATIGVAARSMCDKEETDCELQRVLRDKHEALTAICWQLGDFGMAIEKLEALRDGLITTCRLLSQTTEREVIHG